MVLSSGDKLGSINQVDNPVARESAEQGKNYIPGIYIYIYISSFPTPTIPYNTIYNTIKL